MASRMNATTIRETGGDRVFNLVNYAILAVFLLVILYPLVFIVSSSISDPAAVTSGQVWLWPVNPTLIAYSRILREPALINGFLNSLFYTVVGTAINVVLTILAAY